MVSLISDLLVTGVVWLFITAAVLLHWAYFMIDKSVFTGRSSQVGTLLFRA